MPRPNLPLLALRIFIFCIRHRARAHRAADDYTVGPDALPQPGVPRGKVTQHKWESTIFAGTTRDYWVYVPAQYDGSTPAAVMVFQDGAGCVKLDGAIRVPTVFDNLIHRKEMPVTIGIFINPGTFPSVAAKIPGRSNRSLNTTRFRISTRVFSSRKFSRKSARPTN